MQYRYLVFLLVMVRFSTIGQSLEDYKYVLVPNHYSWTDKADKYQINSLTTFLFNKYGFNAIQLGDILPLDLNKNGCNALMADIVEVDAFLKTKLKIVLKNCKGDTLFVSEEGISRKKDYKWAYQEALREAFYFIEALKYKYRGGNAEVSLEKDGTQEVTSINKGNTLEQDHIEVEVGALEGSLYRSQDGSYFLKIEEEKLVFYDGDKEIGSLASEEENHLYLIKTSEFSGKGYFQDKMFVIEREIKGVQGIVKMIFVKQ